MNFFNIYHDHIFKFNLLLSSISSKGMLKVKKIVLFLKLQINLKENSNEKIETYLSISN